MNILDISSKYIARELTKQDIEAVYALALGNPAYYHHCPPAVTREGIWDDMNALPPGTAKADKYYLGLWEEGRLVAVLDLIFNYPDRKTAYIGFFMLDVNRQGSGIGTEIVGDVECFIKSKGYQYLRLGVVKGNIQAENFWRKNGFVQEKEMSLDVYTVIDMRKNLDNK